MISEKELNTVFYPQEKLLSIIVEFYNSINEDDCIDETICAGWIKGDTFYSIEKKTGVKVTDIEKQCGQSISFQFTGIVTDKAQRFMNHFGGVSKGDSFFSNPSSWVSQKISALRRWGSQNAQSGGIMGGIGSINTLICATFNLTVTAVSVFDKLILNSLMTEQKKTTQP